VSAYQHEFGRPKLVEQLHRSLMVDKAQPGAVHKAFCAMPFELAVTTNVEFLLERGYEGVGKYCRPIVDEDQLSIDSSAPEVKLLKLHGDLHHPSRLIVAEEDYDTFLDRYPLLSTYLANLLIVNTALFVGYSLDDPDFRQVWQVIGSRLGGLRRLAYAIAVSAPTHAVASYKRRGVKVINLPGKSVDYSKILESVFHELGEYWSDTLMEASTSTEGESVAELALPKEATGRLCLFSVPSRLAAFYRDLVFPIAEKHGFAPVMAMDVISPGANITAQFVALLDRAEVVVVDVSIPKTRMEYEMALARRTHDSRLVVVGEHQPALLSGVAAVSYVSRVQRDNLESGLFVDTFESLFANFAADLRPRLTTEPMRLLNKREYRAAVISALSLLESELRNFLERRSDQRERHRAPLLHMIDEAVISEVLNPQQAGQLRAWINVRNQIIHLGEAVSPSTARDIVEGVIGMVQRLNNRPT